MGNMKPSELCREIRVFLSWDGYLGNPLFVEGSVDLLSSFGIDYYSQCPGKAPYAGGIFGFSWSCVWKFKHFLRLLGPQKCWVALGSKSSF